jgi:hypothetical protein
MEDNENSPAVRLRDRMRDAQAEIEKVHARPDMETTLTGSPQEVDRVFLFRNANREMLRVIGKL